jgi:NlpC/P60 family putative phage cell wall peptidase
MIDMPTTTTDRSRHDVVALARRWIGTPYHHQASRLGVGTDCLGLVRGIWREMYGSDPGARATYTRDWAETTGAETLLAGARRYLEPRSASDLQTGRVLVFRFRRGTPAKHLGICTTADRMIHAMEGHPVAEVPLTPWWRRRIVGVFDFPGLAD